MDFVYICRDGDNEELRYSIRSVIHSFPEASIWIVGGKPKWYSGNHIEVKQNSVKYKNAVSNLLPICNSEEITDRLLYEKDVFITPGNIFGSNGEGYIRASLCVDEIALNEVLKRLTA